LLSAFADGQATPAEAVRVEAHLALCADCTSHLSFLRTTAFVFQRSMETPSPQLFERIAAATYAAPPVPTWRERIAAWFNPAQNRLAFGTALAAGIVAAFILPRTAEMSGGEINNKLRDSLATSKPSPSAPASPANIVGGAAVEELHALKGTGLRVAGLWGKQAANYAAPASRDRDNNRSNSREGVRASTSSVTPRGSAASVAGGNLPSTPKNISRPTPSVKTPSTATAPAPTASLVVTPVAPEVTRTPRTVAQPLPSATPGTSSVAIAERTPVVSRPETSIAAVTPKGGRTEAPAPTRSEIEPNKLDRERPKPAKPTFTLGGSGTDSSHGSSVVAAGLPSGGNKSNNSSLTFVGAPVK
jgi:hypothetical protein